MSCRDWAVICRPLCFRLLRNMTRIRRRSSASGSRRRRGCALERASSRAWRTGSSSASKTFLFLFLFFFLWCDFQKFTWLQSFFFPLFKLFTSSNWIYLENAPSHSKLPDLQLQPEPGGLISMLAGFLQHQPDPCCRVLTEFQPKPVGSESKQCCALGKSAQSCIFSLFSQNKASSYNENATATTWAKFFLARFGPTVTSPFWLLCLLFWL